MKKNKIKGKGLEQAKDLLAVGLQRCEKLLETVYKRNALTWHLNSKFFFFRAVSVYRKSANQLRKTLCI